VAAGADQGAGAGKAAEAGACEAACVDALDGEEPPPGEVRSTGGVMFDGPLDTPAFDDRAALARVSSGFASGVVFAEYAGFDAVVLDGVAVCALGGAASPVTA
jgi:hypothetical protein